MDRIARKVERYATLLDLFQPGWEERIRPDTFSLSSDYTCVLGQVFGYYRSPAAQKFQRSVGIRPYRVLRLLIGQRIVPAPFYYLSFEERRCAEQLWLREVGKRLRNAEQRMRERQQRVYRSRIWVRPVQAEQREEVMSK